MAITKAFWRKYKFHCSSLPALMTESRSKSNPLSETAKALLRELWIKEVYGREKILATKYTEKGLAVESDSLELASQQLGFKLFKNKKQLENKLLVGTPDVIMPRLIDIKSSWDLWTYSEIDEEKAKKTYLWQLMGYLWLTGRKEARLVYCLVNTPDYIVEDELYRLHFKVGEAEAEKHRINFVFDDIPAKKRVKQYKIKFDSQSIVALKERLQLAREYLAGLR